MKRSLREVLADSHVGAVALAVLIFWFLDGIFEALWPLLAHAGNFLITAVAILDIPYFSPTLTLLDRSMLIFLCFYLYSAIISISAAWLLSKWLHSTTPLRALAAYRTKLRRANHG
ncbi:MAG TPA: hypothetical protein VF011_18875 [Terriglobales bacterium]